MWNRRYSREVPDARAPPWRDPGRACCTYGPRVRDDAARDSVEKRGPNRLDSVWASHLRTSETIQLRVLAREHSCAVASAASVRAF